MSKPQVNFEISNFINSIAPLISSKSQDSLAASSLLLQGNENSSSLSYQKSLVKFVGKFITDQREFGTTCLQSANAELKSEAVSHYKEGLKAVQWISGFLFSNDTQSTVVQYFIHQKRQGKNEEGEEVEVLVLTFEEIFSRYCYFSNNSNEEICEILNIFFTSIFVPSIAMLSNGALALLQDKQSKFLQSQRWCERGIIQVDNFMKATAKSEMRQRNEMIETSRKTLFGLGVKLRFRLGQALEGQNDFTGAIQEFEKLISYLKRQQEQTNHDNDDDGSTAKLIELSNRDALNKIIQCREKLKQQNENQKGKLSAMFG
jgi:hypothetical protein